MPMESSSFGILGEFQDLAIFAAWHLFNARNVHIAWLAYYACLLTPGQHWASFVQAALSLALSLEFWKYRLTVQHSHLSM